MEVCTLDCSQKPETLKVAIDCLNVQKWSYLSPFRSILSLHIPAKKAKMWFQFCLPVVGSNSDSKSRAQELIELLGLLSLSLRDFFSFGTKKQVGKVWVLDRVGEVHLAKGWKNNRKLLLVQPVTWSPGKQPGDEFSSVRCNRRRFFFCTNLLKVSVRPLPLRLGFWPPKECPKKLHPHSKLWSIKIANSGAEHKCSSDRLWICNTDKLL